MGWKKINLKRYVSGVERNMNLKGMNDIIEKDLLLTLVLAELQKHKIGDELIFKGGTLLSRNHLDYHRFSEDLDFVFKDSGKLRELSRNKREKAIKRFIDGFCPVLKTICDELGLDFETDRSDKKYCNVMHGRSVYTFRLYYSGKRYIKIEINFVEKIMYPIKKITVNAITDFFDSKDLMFQLNLNYLHFNSFAYSLNEVILEKYRAVLTRPRLQERDLFDLFLIKGSMKADDGEIVNKIRFSSLVKRELKKTIEEKLDFLEKGIFFESDEKAEEIAIKKFLSSDFDSFKEMIKSKLIGICRKFIENED